MTELRSRRAQPAELPELMDAPDCDPVELADALDVLAHSGRVFGGERLLRRHVTRVLDDRPIGRLAVLDVGAGGGDAVLALDASLRAGGWAPTFTLADMHALTLRLCRERVGAHQRVSEMASFVRLDGAALPFADDAFDLVICTTTLHHLDDQAASQLMSEFERVARWGWVVTDLRRSALSSAAVRLLAATLWRRHAYPRVDGPTSVRRSFTPAEVLGLMRKAGITAPVVEPRLVRWAARSTVGG